MLYNHKESIFFSKFFFWFSFEELLAFCFLQTSEDPSGLAEQTGRLIDGLTDWLMSRPAMKWQLMFWMSLRKPQLHTPCQQWDPPSQRSPMLTTSCSGWVTEWWMSVERSPLRGRLEKGPHLKTQLHRAGESHRYALFWPRSPTSLQ